MRIFIEPSDYKFLNVGDSAMMQIAFTRLRAFWPEASIQILTDDQEGLAAYCPTAEPVTMRGRTIWLTDGHLFEPFTNILPRVVKIRLNKLETYLRRRWPVLARILIRLRMR